MCRNLSHQLTWNDYSVRNSVQEKSLISQIYIGEGWVYVVFQWPLLVIVTGWIVVLGTLYWLTRLYVYAYERLVTWRGRRQGLRQNIRSKTSYAEWKAAAQELDQHLGNERWKEVVQSVSTFDAPLLPRHSP